MKFNVQKFDEIDAQSVRRLHDLTNDGDRGDLLDNGNEAGSSFRDHLDFMQGGGSYPNSWAIMARDLEDNIVAWCMVTVDPRPGPTQNQAAVGFYVDPSARRQGLGSSLIQEAQEVARKIGVTHLIANPWNQSSSSFFQSNGFETIVNYVTGFGSGLARLDIRGIGSGASAQVGM